MLTRFGDIRDQSRKLSEIAQNFGRFFSPSQILGGRPSKSYTHFITPTLRHVEWKKFCEDTPISPEVLFAHTLNFKPDFKFSPLKFFGGTLVPLWVRASKPSSISSAYKNLRAQHPLRAKILYAKEVHFSRSKLTIRSLISVISEPKFTSPFS